MIMKGFTHIVIDPGDNVVCDFCNEDYTNSFAKGGLLFGTHAVCPDCAPRLRSDAKEYNEESYIRAEAGPDQTFYDFVMRIRKGET